MVENYYSVYVRESYCVGGPIIAALHADATVIVLEEKYGQGR